MNDEQLQVHKLRNGLQTGLLMAALAGLLASLAWFIGGPVLAWGALIGVVVLAMGCPAASPRLLMPLSGARPIRQGDASALRHRRGAESPRRAQSAAGALPAADAADERFHQRQQAGPYGDR